MIRNKKEIKKVNIEKIIGNLKVILFINLLIATYFLSTKTVDYLLTLDVELLKRSLNIILVSLVVILYKK